MAHKRFCDGHFTWHCWECKNAKNWKTIPTDEDIETARNENWQRAILDATGDSVAVEDLHDYIHDLIVNHHDVIDLIDEKLDENKRLGKNVDTDEMELIRAKKWGQRRFIYGVPGRDKYAYCEYSHCGRGGYVEKRDIPNEYNAAGCGHYDYEPPKPRKK
jgi:hypothetical protein